MLKAIVADDEPLLRRELREMLSDLWPELGIVAEVGDGDAALRAIDEQRPAVAFLDVRMPRLDGLEVAERVQGMTQVVFVTAYDTHAVEAFEQGAIDYVLKPIKRTRLVATIERLKGRLDAPLPERNTQARPWLRRVQATLGNTLRFVPVSDVAYFRSDGKYTRVVTTDCEALVVLRRNLTRVLHPKLTRLSEPNYGSGFVGFLRFAVPPGLG